MSQYDTTDTMNSNGTSLVSESSLSAYNVKRVLELFKASINNNNSYSIDLVMYSNE
jgi:hypothetical protein